MTRPPADPGSLIREVLADSPAWRTDAALQPGERLIAVNGVEIDDTTNVFGLFVDTVGERTRLTVRGMRRRATAQWSWSPSATRQRGLRYDDVGAAAPRSHR